MRGLYTRLFKKYFLVFLFIVGFLFPTALFANQADIGPNFVPGMPSNAPTGFWGYVRTMLVQPDGKVLMGGNFSAYKGATANKVIRITSDGSRDAALDVSSLGEAGEQGVYALATQSDGKILVGGEFSTYNGNTVNNILRLTASGAKDTSFVMGNGFNGIVYALAVQSDGKILVGGEFSTYNGNTVNNILRLNTNGSIDAGFDIGDGFDGTVNAIIIQSGNIIIGGNFSSYSGSTANNIVRLHDDGTIDTTFAIGDGFNQRVTALKLQNDGKILVGGWFTSLDGEEVRKIVRLNSDGSKDVDFDTSSSVIEQPTSITIQDDGKIIVGGIIVKSEDNFVRLNIDGSKDMDFNIGAGFGSDDVYALAYVNSKIIVGGNIFHYQDNIINYIASINEDGSMDTTFGMGNGLDDDVYAAVVQPDGKIIAGGAFTLYNYSGANKIVRINADGSRDTGFNIGNGFDGSVFALGLLSSNKIIAAGDFSTYDDNGANKIVRLNNDGSYDASFAADGGFDCNVGYTYCQVNALSVYERDGQEYVLVGGAFDSFGGQNSKNIVRLTTDGLVDSGFDIGSGFNGIVKSIAVQDDGKVLVGGDFTAYSGTTSYRIVRLDSDGSIDTSFATGFNDSVNSISLQSDGKIVVGGAFTSYNGSGANKIIRLNSDGSIDTGFNIGNGFNANVFTTLIQSGNKIMVGGSFSTYKGVAASNIIFLNNDGSKDTLFDGEITVGNKITVLAHGLYGAVIAGGHFMSYKGVPAGYIVSLYGDSELVLLPNSSTLSVVKQEFTNKGYVQSNGDLVGSTPISLSVTDGLVPVDLSLKYHNIKISIPQNVIIKNSADNENYDGIFSMPINKTESSIFNEDVLSAFKIGATTQSLSLAGGTATIVVPVAKSVGDKVHVYFSQNNGSSYYYQGIYTVQNDSHGVPSVTFTTSHFTDFALTTANGSDSDEDEEDQPTTSGGGGGSVSSKDSCPNGDHSSSYYDGTCGTVNNVTGTTGGATQIDELLSAYQWARKVNITTATSLVDANMEGTLLRSHMAKMIVNYAINVLGRKADTKKTCDFDDISDQNAELQGYIRLSCQLGLMGVNVNHFDPNAVVTRAQFGTVLSRVSRGEKYDSSTLYYEDHLEALKASGIMKNITNPERTKELRGWVMLMLMRAAK